ncbi:hypothetical protein EV361DRAFT_909154 [Lentinula raphanica]|nr:hypothetical protein EV361DRAFT_909154 [Lentinula raphanica]
MYATSEVTADNRVLLFSEGTKYGCGHYVATKTVNIIDCMRSTCTKSSRHPPYCHSSDCSIASTIRLPCFAQLMFLC